VESGCFCHRDIAEEIQIWGRSRKRHLKKDLFSKSKFIFVCFKEAG
jgi:hypothetical protein